MLVFSPAGAAVLDVVITAGGRATGWPTRRSLESLSVVAGIGACRCASPVGSPAA
jgi:hypothetical protein